MNATIEDQKKIVEKYKTQIINKYSPEIIQKKANDQRLALNEKIKDIAISADVLSIFKKLYYLLKIDPISGLALMDAIVEIYDEKLGPEN